MSHLIISVTATLSRGGKAIPSTRTWALSPRRPLSASRESPTPPTLPRSTSPRLSTLSRTMWLVAVRVPASSSTRQTTIPLFHSMATLRTLTSSPDSTRPRPGTTPPLPPLSRKSRRSATRARASASAPPATSSSRVVTPPTTATVSSCGRATTSPSAIWPSQGRPPSTRTLRTFPDIPSSAPAPTTGRTSGACASTPTAGTSRG
mmetsp:Transcript_10613/g.31341  ORF Transcript_10613/g.31341 Transcript_10613/m.31341 type:complete len:205 (+) Transcript_10613:6298-6912(+)